jgi:hypothetical protein
MKYQTILKNCAAVAALVLSLPACGDEADEAGDETADEGGTATTTATITTTSTSTGTDGGTEDGGDGDGDTADTTAETSAETDTSADTTGAGCGADPGWTAVAPGNAVKHMQAVTDDGSAWNSCELSPTPFVIDVSTVWCGPCNDAAGFLSGVHNNDPFSGMGNQIRDMINNDVIVWATFLTQTQAGSATTQADGAAWDALYPSDKIPTLTEGDTGMVESGLQVGCFPSAYVVDENNNFLAVEDCATWNQLQTLVMTYG